MKTKKYLAESKTVVFGSLDFLKRLIKGFIIAFLFLIISNFIDISFGFAWRETTYVIILIILTGFTIFLLFRKFSHSSLFYLLGWVIGVFVFGKMGVIPSDKGLLYIITPLVISVFRLIFSFFKKN
jgi:hypothetical protein